MKKYSVLFKYQIRKEVRPDVATPCYPYTSAPVGESGGGVCVCKRSHCPLN